MALRWVHVLCPFLWGLFQFKSFVELHNLEQISITWIGGRLGVDKVKLQNVQSCFPDWGFSWLLEMPEDLGNTGVEFSQKMSSHTLFAFEEGYICVLWHRSVMVLIHVASLLSHMKQSRSAVTTLYLSTSCNNGSFCIAGVYLGTEWRTRIQESFWSGSNRSHDRLSNKAQGVFTQLSCVNTGKQGRLCRTDGAKKFNQKKKRVEQRTQITLLGRWFLTLSGCNLM